MALKTTIDQKVGNVDRFIPTAYDKVKIVADNIIKVIQVSDWITNGNIQATIDAVALVDADRIAAEAAAAAAAADAAATALVYDTFDDRYLGEFASAPTLDNDGDPLVQGALYFDSTLDEMFVYTGTVWIQVTGAGGGVWEINGDNSAYYINGGLGNIALGIPAANMESWDSTMSAFQIGGNSALMSQTTPGVGNGIYMMQNAYFATDGWHYQEADEATMYRQLAGVHEFYVATTGTVDGTPTWILGMTVENDGTVTADINAAYIAGATYKSVQSNIYNFHSSGVVTGFGLSDGGAGTLNVASGSGYIRAANSVVDPILGFDHAGTTGLALTSGQINYIYIEYNAGSPQIVSTTVERTDLHTNVYLGNVYKYASGELHINQYRRYDVGDHASKMITRMQSLSPMAHESGGIISETGTRNIAVTVGAFWEGFNRLTTPAVDTSVADTFRYFYDDGASGWTEVLAQTQINNTQYDDGSGTLATLSPSHYGVHWVYLATDGDVYVVYGRGDYTLSQALVAEVPPAPPHVEGHGRLIGRIIIQNGASTFYNISSAFTESFTTAGVTDHTNLTNIGTNTHAQIDTHIADILVAHPWVAGTADDIYFPAGNNVGLDTAPQATLTAASVWQRMGPHGYIAADSTAAAAGGFGWLGMYQNLYYDTGYKYIVTGAAGYTELYNGEFRYFGAVSGTGDTAASFTQGLRILPGGQIQIQDGTVGIPSLSYANDTTTGFYRSNTGIVSYTSSGSRAFYMASSGIFMNATGGAAVMNEVVSATNPTLIPDNQSLSTGVGSPLTGALSLTTGGIEAVRVDVNQNVGVGVIPNTWTINNKVIQIGTTGMVGVYDDGAGNYQTWLTNNVYYDGADRYIVTHNSAAIKMDNSGAIKFQVTASGTSGTAITWANGLIIDNNAQVSFDTSGIFIVELVSANTDRAGYGQVWVKNDAPNTLWFTDDAGTDFQIGGTGLTLGGWQASGTNLLIIDSGVTDIYLGDTTVSATPSANVLHAEGGSGTDIAGAALTFAGGAGTGAGAGGDIIFQYASSGASSATPNTPTSRFLIRGDILRGNITTSGAILNESSTVGNPVILPRADQLTNGLGSNGANEWSLIIQGVETAKVFYNGTYAARQVIHPTQNIGAAPSIAFGDGDSGFFESTDDNIYLAIAGFAWWHWNSTLFHANQANGPGMVWATASSTVPTLVPSYQDTNTGIGWASADNLSLITGGTEYIRIDAGGQIHFINNGSTYHYEKAAAAADVTGAGQIWVKNDTPNTLWFTDDVGTDFQIGGAAVSSQWVKSGTDLLLSDGTITATYFADTTADASPQSHSLYGQSGSGTDIAGADLHIYAGTGTGTGAGGKLVFHTALAGGTTGSSPNAYADSLVIDQKGSIGIGGTPSTNWSAWGVLQLGDNNALHAQVDNGIRLSANLYWVGLGSPRYYNTANAGYYGISNGTHIFNTAPSGTAGTSPTFTQGLKIDNTGHLIVRDASEPATPTIQFGTTLTGFCMGGGTSMVVSVGGTGRWRYNGDAYQGEASSSAAIRNVAATAAVATLVPNRGSSNSGIGAYATGGVSIITGGNEVLRFTTDQGVLVKEIAAAVADVAGYGQIWVKNTTPNELWFTDDTGTDFQLSGTSSPWTTASGNIYYDSGQVGVGTTSFDTWTAGYEVLEVGDQSTLSWTSGELNLTHNAYYSGTWKYKATDYAHMLHMYFGYMEFKVASSGTADTSISWTTALTINPTGTTSVNQGLYPQSNIYNNSGSAAAPSYVFGAGTTTGLYYFTSSLGVSVLGTARATFNADGLFINNPSNINNWYNFAADYRVVQFGDSHALWATDSSSGGGLVWNAYDNSGWTRDKANYAVRYDPWISSAKMHSFSWAPSSTAGSSIPSWTDALYFDSTLDQWIFGNTTSYATDLLVYGYQVEIYVSSATETKLRLRNNTGSWYLSNLSTGEFSLNDGTTDYIVVDDTHKSIGLGIPEANLKTFDTNAIQMPGNLNFTVGMASPSIAGKAYYGSAAWKYETGGAPQILEFSGGAWIFAAAGTGTIDTTITWVEQLAINSYGHMFIDADSVAKDWVVGSSIVQIGGGAGIEATTSRFAMHENSYYANTGGVDKYIATAAAAKMDMDTGVITFRVAGSGTAGNTITWGNALTIDNSENVAVGDAALATTATDGFLYIPTCNGAPTGTPTSKTGLVPIIFDTANNDLYIYDGGWVSVTLA